MSNEEREDIEEVGRAGAAAAQHIEFTIEDTRHERQTTTEERSGEEERR